MSSVILVDNYSLTKIIGKGSYGKVYYTTKKGSNIPYATKRMKRETVEDPNYLRFFINEITILKEIYHKNIVRIEALKKTNNHYYIVMDYCNGGTLLDNYHKYKMKYGSSFPEKIIQHILRQVIEAVAYLHSQNIVHRDLKLENILIHFNSEEAKNNIDILNSELKLIDFGTATRRPNNTIVGSPLNMDPTILKMFVTGQKEKLPYDEKIDIWSLGIISYYLFTGDFPFIGNYNDLMEEIEKGDICIPISISAEAISFLLRMLQFSSKKRFNAAELLTHPFIQRYIGDFTYLDKKILHNFIKNGNLCANIKNSDGFDSILNQYIYQDKHLNTISSNNNSETNYSLSIDAPSIANSAPIIKGKIAPMVPQVTSNYYNSAIFNPQKDEQFESLMNELKNKEKEINNRSQNLSNSSPMYILSKNLEPIEFSQPYQNSMMEMPHNSFNNQKESGFLNKENKSKNNQNISQKSVNKNIQYNENNNNITNSFQSKPKNEEKNDNGIISSNNKNETSKIINSFNQVEYLSGKYNSVQPQMMNSVNYYQPNYGNGSKNNNNFNYGLSTQYYNSSTPIQGIKNSHN